MTWANLGILGLGGLLLLVPIVLHFLMRPKPKDIVFPALRFLKARQQSNTSSLRIRHFLLLLMRCLLIGLVALALAGPSVASADYGNWLRDRSQRPAGRNRRTAGMAAAIKELVIDRNPWGTFSWSPDLWCLVGQQIDEFRRGSTAR